MSKTAMLRPDACPEGFKDLEVTFNAGKRRLPQSDPTLDPSGLYLKFYGHKENGNLIGFARFGMMMEGPPGCVHGGMLAYVLDEAMGTAAWNLKLPVVAEKIEVEFKKMAPQNQFFQIEAHVEHTDGKRVHTFASISDSQGHVLSQAKGVFHLLSPKQLQAIAEQAGLQLPEWLKNFKLKP